MKLNNNGRDTPFQFSETTSTGEGTYVRISLGGSAYPTGQGQPKKEMPLKD